ncbi:MAG: hypothetical protein J5789_02615 [Oscillospiraceae bacterium]|nr:hypothetical protein [Oscillospiraceae bacterium]
MRNFKKILLTCVAFVLLVGLLSIGFMEVYFRTEYDVFQDGSERDALAGTIDCLYCGASHGYRAFKPSVIDPILGTRSYNLSGAMMTMQGRYELLRDEIERNPVKQVYLEVSFGTMTRNRVEEGPEGDLYTLARLNGFSRRADYFFRCFSVEEYPDVYRQFLSLGIDAALQLFRGQKADHSRRDRGYVPAGIRTMEFDTNYTVIFHSKKYPTQIDPYNQEYLDKILALCQAHDIEVILVTTPLSKTALCQSVNLQYFYEWYRDFAKERGLRFYDFNLYREKERLFPDETMFYDTLHFNDEGASLFSRLFAELMVRADSGEDLSDLFFATYPAMEDAVFGT